MKHFQENDPHELTHWGQWDTNLDKHLYEVRQVNTHYWLEDGCFV